MALRASSHYLSYVTPTMRNAFQIIKDEYAQLRVGYVQAGAGASMQRYPRKECLEKMRRLCNVVENYDDESPLDFLRGCANCIGAL